MQLTKTKLAGIISLLLCTGAQAMTVEPVAESADQTKFGPFAAAINTTADATTAPVMASFEQTFAQPFSYDIGAPWTYNEYCVYDGDICDMLWEGSRSDGSNGLYVWRLNLLNTYTDINGTGFISETESTINTGSAESSALSESRKITAIAADGTALGYATDTQAPDKITRRGFYGDTALVPAFIERGGFSSAFDAADVTLTSTAGIFSKMLVVGQASVAWPDSNNDNRFNYCFNQLIDDDRYDYDDLYLCPGFNVQASFWQADGAGTDVKFLNGNSDSTGKTWIGGGSDATFLANAYAINSSGFAVGFSTQQIYSSTSGGRARAVIFKPTVVSPSELSYDMTEITKPKTDVGGDYNDIIRDTVAIDISDNVYDSARNTFVAASGTDDKQAFIVVGNRKYAQPQNRSYATEFFTYDVKSEEVRYPFLANPIKGANSQVSKINNQGIIVGWRDARGETSPTYDGSPRLQSAFIYDYASAKSAYLDDVYCQSQIEAGEEVRVRLTNAISVSDPDAAGEFIILSNGYDYGSEANYTSVIDGKPGVFKITMNRSDLATLPMTSQCPIKAEQSYKRQGAGMGSFMVVPLLMLIWRRIKR